MKLLYFFVTTALFCCFLIPAFGQNAGLSGRILDENGLGLPGATVFLVKENSGTVTDINGNFNLIKIPAREQTLRITYIGYKTLEQNISLAEGNNQLAPIQMTAEVFYGKDVLVIGDRLKGQAKALNQQRYNANITNIVAADQIGRFPDANIGDAMKRIPGITMQYDQGEARFGLIRGTAPALNAVTVNGERIPSAEAENRSVQLDLIPADMVQTIEVNKALTPDMDADAIGGSVNLVTRAAPSGLRVSGTLAGGYGLLREKPVYSGGLVIGNRYFNDKLGVILSGSYHNNQFGSDNAEAEWNEEDGVAFVEDLQVRRYNIQRVRRSVSASLDYKLHSNHTFQLRWIYNYRDDWENRFRTRYKDMSLPDESGFIDGVTIERQTKGGGDNRGKNARLEDQRTRTLTLSGDHIIAQKLQFSWSGTLARASEERPDERYISWELDEAASGSVNISNPNKPLFSPSKEYAYNLYELDELSTEDQFTEETDKNFRADFILPLSDNFEHDIIKLGVRGRFKEKLRDNKLWEASPLLTFSETMDGHPLADYTLSNFQAGPYTSGALTDYKYLGGLALRNPDQFELEEDVESLAGNFNATEDIMAVYAMINKAIGNNFSFIAGLRLENTQLTYKGYQFDTENEELTATKGKDEYTNILPALHLKYNATEQLVLRAALTNTLARPNYFDLVPYRFIEDTDELLVEGNPKLSPTTSMNVDLMAENYFKSIGLLSAGVFYKDLQDVIYTYRADNYTDALSGITFEEYQQARNGASASIAGFEVAIQRQLDFLPGLFRGFGIYANYTYTTSKTDKLEGREDEKLELPGTAGHMFNTSLAYENKKLAMRLSLNYTSDYLDQVGESAFFDRYYDTQTFLDFNASYAFTPQLRAFFEANNLTNQPLRYYQGIQARMMQHEFYRARFTLGAKFDLFGE